MTSFKAILLEKSEDGKTVAAIKELSNSMLAFEDEGWVTVDVSYSTVNFKDGLAVTGKSPVVRKFPLIPGIDLVGKIASSKNKSWKIGDQVVLNGWGVGEAHSGGLSQRACVHGDWLIPKPENLSPWETMAIGTAGYTASLCVLALNSARRAHSGRVWFDRRCGHSVAGLGGAPRHSLRRDRATERRIGSLRE